MTQRKASADRQNRSTQDRVVELVPGAGPAEVPAPPDGWLPDTVAGWEAFWQDDQLMAVVRGVHRPAVVRLFTWVDRLHRAWALADALRAEVGDDHIVEGSTGQARANPLYERADKAEASALAMEARVAALEDRFGLTPGALLKMGVDFQRRTSLEVHNAAASRAVAAAAGEGDGGEADPRSA